MKTFTITFIILILAGCGNTQIRTKKNNHQKESAESSKCNCDGLVDWQKNVIIKLFDQPGGQIIDTLTHDIRSEDFLTFTIIDSKEHFFKAKIGRAIQGQRKIGWIKKEKYLGTYARNYSGNDTLFLYTKPDKQSLPTDTINEYYTELYQIIDCDGQWAKVTMKTNNKEFKGWMEPEMQCSSPYTTCN